MEAAEIRFWQKFSENLRNFPVRGAEKRQKNVFLRQKKRQKIGKTQFYLIGNQYITKKMQKK